MLSGIGDREQLAEHGIDVVADVPEVGQNLMDHLAVPMGFDVADDTLIAAEKPMQLTELPDYVGAACSPPTSARRTDSSAADPNSTCRTWS